EFQVNQSGWTAMNPNRSFTIGCECSTTDTVNEWELEMKLQKESDSDWFCIATENGNSKGNCFGKKKAWNKAEFTLTDQAGDHVDNYTCTFTRTHPLPIILKQGKGTIVFPTTHCLESNLLLWILGGVAAFFCICSLSLTYAFITLRRESRDPDGNAEYVDMRKVRPVNRGSARDINYNSHSSFFVGQ
ncbi:hypothetical protein GN956_G13055, partial [Arapaima gigas]